MAKKQNELVEYLENIITLEKTSYAQGEMIKEINRKIDTLGNSSYISKSTVEKNTFGECVGTMALIFAIGGVILGALIGLFSKGNILEKLWALISEGFTFGIYGLGAGIVVGLIYFFYCKAKESKLEKEAEREYLDEKALDNKRVNREREQIKRLDMARDAVVDARVQTVTLLNKYYEANVLYSSYQNMAAVCSICEYLKSGKCSELKGHEGAYVLYDNERRLDRIVERLDDIVVQLDQIKASQFMLYSAIQEGNRITNKVLQETYRQTELQEFSAKQNAITAHNSEVAARELSMSNWLKVYELHRKGM